MIPAFPDPTSVEGSNKVVRAPCCSVGWALAAVLLSWAIPTSASSLQVSPQPTAASGYTSRLWNTVNGLPINEIRGIEKTPDGYLWLATFGGLVRFDGRRFTVYRSSEHPALPSDRIDGIRLTRSGSLLLTTELGHLTEFDGTDFTLLVPGPLSDGRVTSMWKDSSGQLWLALDHEDFGRMEGGEFVPAFEIAPGWDVVKTERVGDVTWVGTADGRVFAVGASGVSDHTPDSGDGRLPWSQLTDLARGPDGRIYVGTAEGLFRMDPARGRPEQLTSGFVDALLTSPDGTSMVAQSSDAVRIEADGVPRPVIGSRREAALPIVWGPDGTLWHASGATLLRAGQPVAQVTGLVHDILVDDGGSTWVASQGGLVQVTPTIFTTHSPSLESVRSACRAVACVSTFAVYAIQEMPDSSLLLGTLDFGTWELSTAGDLTWVSSLSSLSLHATVGGVWTGTFGGVCTLAPSACIRPAGTEGIGTAVVRAMASGPDGDRWVGAEGSLIRVRNGRATRYGAAQGLPDEQVVSLIPTADGGVWVGTFGGIARLRDGRFEVLDQARGLSSSLVRSMHLAEDSVLWVGTEGRGLNRVALTGGSLGDAEVTQYSTRNGLYSDGIHTILDDGLGRLWMSSNEGIFWVRQAELDALARGEATAVHSVAYLERDGLGNREANGGTQSAGLRASDGRLWFATMGGAAVVDPREVTLRTRPLSVLIESATSGEVQFRPSEPVLLESGNRNLQVEYTVPTFRGSESLRFRYRLDGYDADWIEVGGRRTAFYTNLPPGDHRFRVAAVSADGVWYEALSPLEVSVVPLFYERAWFVPMLLLMALGLGRLLVVRRQEGLVARASALSGLVAERTAQLEQEKEESEQARRDAELAEVKVKEALEVVAGQAQHLQDLDRAKSRFIANISHELRTPLTLTIGPLEDLREELAGQVEDETMQDVDIALRNSRRLLRMVNQLLDVAKVEAGQLEVRPERLDLAELVRFVAEAFAPLAERRGVTLVTTGFERVMYATVDGDAIDKILLNLLSNAFRATPPGKSVYLTLEGWFEIPDEAGAVHPRAREASRARIIVRDEGAGIPPDVLPHIFERFYQGEDSRPSDDPGSGIGLSLVRELVQLHHGEIHVESATGAGSRFIVDLPTAALDMVGRPSRERRQRPRMSAVEEVSLWSTSSPEDEGLEVSPAIDVGGPHTTDDKASRLDDRMTILLADDNAEIRAYVRKHLSDTYRVIEAENGRQALEIASAAPPDLVIADVMMPEMDGEELCRRIKSDADLQFVPVILLTARASAESRLRALELGADEHLTKPFDKTELRARIANLIAGRQKHRDRLRSVEIVASGAEPIQGSAKERFLGNVRAVILERMGDEEFGVEELALALGHSRAHLYRRLRELHDQSPAELIKTLRLKRATDLLRSGEASVSEVAFTVGFKSVSHFSRSFRASYGETPSDFVRTVSEKA